MGRSCQVLTSGFFALVLCDPKKRPPYFAYNARSASGMNSDIPPDVVYRRLKDQLAGSNPIISSRLSQRMISDPAILR
jgi:hypothetical protein